MIEGRIFNLTKSSELTSDTSKTVNAPTALSLVSPSVSPNTATAVIVRISGVVNGGSVKVFSDSTCSTLLSETVAASETADINLSFSVDGTYTLYAQIVVDGQASSCSTQSVTYQLDRIIGLPTVESIQSPASDFETSPNPVIRIGSAEIGAVIKLYSDSACMNFLGSKVATAINDDVSLALTTQAQYSIYAQQTDAAGNASACSTTYVEYTYAKSFNVTSTTTVTNVDAAIDGICSDAGGKCSLRAAFDEVAAVSATPFIFEMDAGTYSVNTGFSVNYRNLKLRGVSPATTILQGNGTSNAFKSINTSTNRLDLENIEVKSFRTAAAFEDIFGGENGTYKVKNAYIRNNTKVAGHANGAILKTGNGYSYFDNVLFENNNAASGSVLYLDGDGDVYFKNVLFKTNLGWNTIETTGAMLHFDSVTFNDSVTITAISMLHSYGLKANNLIITGMTATAIYAHQNSGRAVAIDLLNSTLYNNGAGTYGNFYLSLNSGSMVANIHNSIIAINAAKANCTKIGPNAAAIVINSSYSLFDEATCGTGTGNITAAPLLNAFASSSPFYGTLIPQGGSPTIDSGSNALCMAKDITGLTRPIDKLGGGAKCDMGAVEVP